MATDYPANPSATQAPASAPGSNVMPIISIPAGTDAPTIESITQALKCHTDYNGWLTQRVPDTTDNFMVDDFLGSAVATDKWSSVTSGVALVDDSANGGAGALFLNTGAVAGTYTIQTQNMNIGANDFRISFRLRCTLNGATTYYIGMRSATAAQEAYMQCSFANNWQAVVGAGTAQTLSTAQSATYNKFEILRTSGTIYFIVNGTTQYTTAFATSQTSVALKTSLGALGTDSVYIDSVRLWVKR